MGNFSSVNELKIIICFIAIQMAYCKEYNSTVIISLKLYIPNFITMSKLLFLLKNLCDMYQIKEDIILYLRK